MSTSAPKSSTTIQSLQVGCDIIERIAFSEQPMKFNEICEKTGITKSNLYKYLNTLTQNGWLYRSKDGFYSLGSKLAEYGLRAVNQENVIDRVTPYLQEIQKVCKSTVILTSWSHNGPVVVKLITNQHGLNIGASIGTALPLLSSSGKIFAAFMDEAVIGDWKSKQLAAMSDEQKDRLEAEVGLVREQGISFAREPLVPSISSIALPIFNYEKRLLASFGVVGFTDVVPKNTDDVMSQYLLKANKEISQVFGYKSI